MGYTIYYKTREGEIVTKEEVRKCVEEIKKLVEENKDIIDYEFPEAVDKYNVNFNGVNEEGETFCFYSDYKDNRKEEILDKIENKEFNPNGLVRGKLDFNCCKTHRNGYDRFVKTALMKIQEITNNKFEVTCDDNYIYEKDGIYEEGGEGKKGEFIARNLDGLDYKYYWNN